MVDDQADRSGSGGRDGRPGAQLVLEPVLTSPRSARHWVTTRLAPWPPDLRQTAALLVSELVANAVLHACTPVAVTLSTKGLGVRVEVSDGSVEMPTIKGYQPDAATGRGLSVVDALADDWGTRLEDAGKTVWFTLGAAHRDEPVARAEQSPGTVMPAARPGPIEGPGANDGDAKLVDVALLGVPVPLIASAQAAYDELFREFRLIVEGDPERSAGSVQSDLLSLVSELATRFSHFTIGVADTWQAAALREDASVDLHYVLPESVGAACRRYDALLDQAEDYCRAAELLTLAPAHDIVAFRKWLLSEFSRQAVGEAPVSWHHSEWATAAQDSG